MKHNIMWSILY